MLTTSSFLHTLWLGWVDILRQHATHSRGIQHACTSDPRYTISVVVPEQFAEWKSTGTMLMVDKGAAVTWLQCATHCGRGLSALCLWLCPAGSRGQPACCAIRQSSREDSAQTLSAMLPVVGGPSLTLTKGHRGIQRSCILMPVSGLCLSNLMHASHAA